MTTGRGARGAASSAASAGRRVAAARLCAALAAVCHLSWVTEAVSPSHLPTRTSYVSELMALDQPWSTGMRATDTVAGLLVLAAALLARSSTRTSRHTRGAGTRRLTRVGILGLAVFGVATIADASSPMSCAPSVSHACAAAEAAGTVPLHHVLHSVSSSIATLGAVVGFVAVAALLSVRTGVRPWIRGVVAVTVAAYVATTVWVLLEVGGATPGTFAHGRTGWDLLGWSQRTQVTLSSITLLLIAALTPDVAGRGRR